MAGGQDNFYFNPGSTKPDVSPLPAGLQGYLAQDQQRKYDTLMNLQEALSKLEYQGRNEEYTQGAPMRQAERSYKTSDFGLKDTVNRQAMQTPGYAQGAVAGMMGKDQSTAAAGQEAMVTMPGRIGAVNAKNSAEEHVEHLRRQKAFMEQLDVQEPLFQLKDEVAPGVTRGSQNYAEWYSKLPEGVKKQLPSTYDATAVKQVRDKLTNSIGHAQKLSEIGATGDEHARQETIRGEYGIKREREKATAKNKSVEQMVNEAVAKQDDNRILNLDAYFANDEDVDAKLRTRLKDAAGQARKNLAERMAKGQIDFGNIKGGAGPVAKGIEQRLGAQPPNPQQGQIHSMVELRGMYPGKSDTWIKDAYSKRFGVNPRE